MNITSDIGKKEFLFTVGRYVTYFIQIAKGFLLAKILGPELFGIYGIFLLAQQYLVYSNLGVQYALNIELSVNYIDQSLSSDEVKSIIDSSFTLFIATSFVLIIVALITILLEIDLGLIIPNSHFFLGLLAITILFHLQEIFLNLFRIQRRLYVILFTEILLAVSGIMIIPFFKGLDLLYAIIITWSISLLFSICIFRIRYQGKIHWNLNYIKPLLYVGIPFVLYNFSFNLISMIPRSFVAFNFTTVEMGLFSFSVSLSTALMLVFNSITWVLYPKVISKLSDPSLDQIDQEILLASLGKKTISFIILLTICSFSALPIIFYLLPEYSNAFKTTLILLINQIVINSTFVITSYLVGRNMFQILIISALFSVGISIVSMLLLAGVDIGIELVSFINLFGSLIFVNLLLFLTSKKAKLRYENLLKTFAYRAQLSLVASALCILLDYVILGLVVFMISMLAMYRREFRDSFILIRTKISSNGI